MQIIFKILLCALVLLKLTGFPFVMLFTLKSFMHSKSENCHEEKKTITLVFPPYLTIRQKRSFNSKKNSDTRFGEHVTRKEPDHNR